ncbi:aldehyde dehydrogenase family protein [Amorphus sp. MBR-141]
MDARHFIAGGWQPSADGRTGTSLNPATGDRLGIFSDGGVAEVETAIAAARRAFDETLWAHSPRDRQMVLLRWADAMEARTDALAHCLTLTNGKPLAHSKGEIAGAVSEIRYYAGLTRHFPGSAMEVAPGEFATMIREPAGVAGLIIPWNAPAVLLIRSLAPALGAGCTTVTKPAPQTALFSAMVFETLVGIPGLPDGVVNVFFETGHEGAMRLVASEDVDTISFTGSTRVGEAIMVAGAPTMKKLSLELGGKSCCVVLADADVEAIAPKLAAAATIISGQQCTGARRVLVHESRYAEMKTALASALAAIKVGNGLDDGIGMGPLIDQRARSTVQTEIEAAFDACDEVLLRGGIPDGAPEASAFLTPSLVAQRDENAAFCQEEVFGPLLVLEPFADEKEAVKKANNTTFGLSASVWTNDGPASMRLARALRNGTVWINDHNKLFAEAETGGYRRSGIGRLHGYDALHDFSELKHIYQNVGTVS